MTVDPLFDYQFRLILIGDSTVGKSSLLKYFTDGKFAEISDPTVGVDFFARLVTMRDGAFLFCFLFISTAYPAPSLVSFLQNSVCGEI
ncbi:ras-related protein Rab-39B-like [Diaphorina citri]|uniref:Ras-related protein Rab-39B-like n=1 Tax=Diaphorina citri TaxID=121845 RepID=A0A1S3D2E5_DIACI|nr:ras-related protein Rab-39B-like [Diaphorina citri]